MSFEPNDERIPLLQGVEVRSQPNLTATLLALFIDTVPVILSYTLQVSIQAVSILIAGRLGPDELSAASVSVMLAFVTGFVVALGGTTALDTLGSASYASGNRPADLSLHFQRCLVLLYALFVPVAFLWVFMEPVLLFLGQPPNLCRDVQSYLRVLLIGAPGFIGLESLKKYLLAQHIMRAPTYVLIAVWPINLGLNVVLIHHTPLGLLGSPTALSITYWLAFGLLSLFTYYSPTHTKNKTWGGIQPRSIFNLQSCITFYKLALPGILMVATEWVAFEIVALAAGQLGSLPLAAQAVIMTSDQIMNTIPFGISVAASNRVANMIGKQNPSAARMAGHASALLSVILGAIVMIILLASKDVFGYLFSDDHDVVRLVSDVMPLVASFQIADGLAGACGGVLRGQGRQHIGAAFNAVAYYVLALPIGIYLAFNAGMELQGLWLGQVIGLFLVGFGEYAAVWWTDWPKEIERAKERIENDVDERSHST